MMMSTCTLPLVPRLREFSDLCRSTSSSLYNRFVTDISLPTFPAARSSSFRYRRRRWYTLLNRWKIRHCGSSWWVRSDHLINLLFASDQPFLPDEFLFFFSLCLHIFLYKSSALPPPLFWFVLFLVRVCVCVCVCVWLIFFLVAKARTAADHVSIAAIELYSTQAILSCWISQNRGPNWRKALFSSVRRVAGCRICLFVFFFRSENVKNRLILSQGIGKKNGALCVCVKWKKQTCAKTPTVRRRKWISNNECEGSPFLSP